jgi:hypothetical protein
MSDARQTGLAVGHPSPARHRVNPLLLALALGAPPAAWLAQLLLAFAPASYFCWFGVTATPPVWLGPLAVSANLVAIVAAFAAFAVALRIVRQTGPEHGDNTAGLIEIGEGRTRFLAIWAAFIAVVFAIAILANTLSLHLVALCQS